MRKWMILLTVLALALGLAACEKATPTPTEAPAMTEEAPKATEAPAMTEEAPKATEEPTEAAEEGEMPDCASPDVLCVGLVTDVGEIDDKSFNQSAWEGVLKAKEELGAYVDYIETKDPKDYEANIRLFAENGFDVIVTVGFALGEATQTMAKEFPEVYFIGVDQFQAWAVDDDTGNDLPNVAGLIFHEDRAGFLAGALAGMITKTNKIAGVLGTDLVPPVKAFGTGYINGAKYVNENVEAKVIYHPGGLDVAFTDPEWGAATARQLIDQGYDVIFGAGGKTGNGALIEVAEAAKAGKEVYCIGVDTDQWYTVPEARPCLVTSAMKLITPGVFDLIKMAKEGNFPAGNYYGGVGLAPFHDFEDAIPQEVKDKLEEIRKGLEAGEIPTGWPIEE